VSTRTSDLVAFLGAIAALSVVTFSYLTHWDINFSSDTALIGLIAKSIFARGELPIFVWSVGYQGMLLEAYPAALLMKLFGTTPFVLSLTPTIYLWLALGVWTYGASRVASHSVAALMLVATVLSLPLFYQMNLRTMPNFPETLLLGGMALVLFQRIMGRINGHKPINGRALVLFGFVCGLSLYTFAIAAFFWGAIALSAAIVLYREELRRGCWAFVRSWVVPWQRLAVTSAAGRAALAALSALGIVAVCVGIATIGVTERLDLGSRTIKWNPLATMTIGTVVAVGPRLALELWRSWRQSPATKRAAALFAGGFLVGYAPAIVYRLTGGSSVKRAFAAGSWTDVEHRFGILLAFHRDLFHWDGSAVGWVIALVHAAAVTAFFVFVGRSIRGYVTGRIQAWPMSATYALVAPVAWLLFVLSRTVTDIESRRYLVFLVPVYAFALAWTAVRLREARPRLRALVVVSYCAILWQGAVSLRQDLFVPRALPFATIEREMTARQLTLGYADYWLAYATNFLTDERVMLEPVYSNYSPHYAAAVAAAPRLAYLDYSPPRLSIEGDRLEKDGVTYRVTETTPLELGVTLRVLERVSP
jgi:hypothetical protein